MEELIKLLETSDLKLVERETGIPYDRMYKWRRGLSKPKMADYTTLMAYFKGKSSISGKTSNPRLEATPVHLASDPNEEYPDKFNPLGDGTIAMRIPVVRQKAYAGYLRGFADPVYYEDLPTMTIDVYNEHKGNYIAFEVSGDSMTSYDPATARYSIYEGYFVVGREVARHLWNYKLHTHYVDAWIIVHQEEGIVVKNIVQHDVEKGTITIHSLNPKYEDEVWNLDDIQQIFSVVQKIDKM